MRKFSSEASGLHRKIFANVTRFITILFFSPRACFSFPPYRFKAPGCCRWRLLRLRAMPSCGVCASIAARLRPSLSPAAAPLMASSVALLGRCGALLGDQNKLQDERKDSTSQCSFLRRRDFLR